MTQIFERSADGGLRETIRSASTFGELINALKLAASAIGEDETEQDMAGQVQYGLRKRGQKARKEINAKAREIVARVQGDPEKLSEEDRDILQQYSGRGGIQDDNSLSEYYTPTPIAEGVWDMLKENGFENGNVLEPSAGAGVFLATKPAGTIISGAEIDETSSSVSQLLHPDDRVENQSFEQLCAEADDNSFDSVIGNVPFGDTRGKWAKFDPDYQEIKEMERYFVTRAIDKVRFDGLVALIVPPNIISRRGKNFVNWRREISKKAEFLGAHKLPSGTFGGANGNGTDTVVDVLIMRKHSREVYDKIPDLKSETLVETNVLWDQFISGRWFEKDGKRFVHGEIVEGFRTVVKASIDNQSLKKQLARKFSSRIDYAALDAAETIVRNYVDGDRRRINGRMYEMAGGEWILVQSADGIGSGDSIDESLYGVGTVKELQGILQEGDSVSALELSFENAMNARQGPFGGMLKQSVRDAIAVANSVDEDMQERVYRGALIGAEVSEYARQVSETGQVDNAKIERLQRLVTAESEKYGNPATDRRLRNVTGPGSRSLAYFVQSMTKEGGFSDLLTGERTGQRGESFDSADPSDIVRHLAVRTDGGPVDLDSVIEIYSGDEALTLEILAESSDIAITGDGMIQPLTSFASGDIVKKISSLREAMMHEKSQKLIEKYQSQIDHINAKRKLTSVDDITFNLRGKWLGQKYATQFLHEKGYDFLRFDDEKGEWVAAFGYKPQRFEKQLMNYLNGQAVRSKDRAAAAEYKQQIQDFNEEFNFFLRQHDDIEDLVAEYNDRFNGYLPYEYDGSDLALDNVADWIKPHDYQAAGVRRLSDEGRGILAFDVGLGKSLAALSLAQYNAQKGRAKRTCIVVPKAVLENWYHESRQFFKSMNHVHFVGFTAKKGEQVPVLDENGQHKINKRTGKPQYRDVLVEDSASVIMEKMNQIPQTAKSLVVMSRERFGMIPLRPETRESYADDMVSRNLLSDSKAAELAVNDKVSLGRGGSYDEVKKSEAYQQKYNDGGTRKKDDYPFYEDMGFDSVIVDEGHEYKNTYSVSGDTARLAYLPTPAPSKRALDMATKMDYLRKNNSDRGPVMLTATPVTNSPVEIYNMLSHLVPPSEFDSMGIYNADDFVREFCKVENVERVKLSGEVVTEEGVKGFKNLDALRTIFHRYVNMKSAEDVNDESNSLKMPDSTEVNDAVEMTPEQASIYEELRAEADKINQSLSNKAPDEEGDPDDALEEARPVFAIIRDMDRITTDMDLYMRTMTFTMPSKYADAAKKLASELPKSVKRMLRDEETGEMENVPVTLEDHLRIVTEGETTLLVVHELYEEEVAKRLKKHGIVEKEVAHPVMPKYARLLENLRTEYEGGGKQIVFTEEKSQHNKLKRIITHHLPIEAKEIGIINADTASGDKLEKIANAYNTGQARIIIANKKAEVGVNLQKGTTAIHHLTLPWTPASIQQRNGRGVRQGNTAANVDVHYYLGKGSFDEYRLQMLKQKSSWMKDLFFGEDPEADNANAASDEEMAVMLAPDPEEARRRIEENRARQLALARERANKKAAISLSNLKKHKHWLANYQDAEDRAAENAVNRGRKPEDARKAMQEKREKMLRKVKQMESELLKDSEKGRIDYNAEKLVSSGSYTVNTKGQVFSEGDIMESRNRADGSLGVIVSIDEKDKILKIKDLLSEKYKAVSFNNFDSYKKSSMSPDDAYREAFLRSSANYQTLMNDCFDQAWIAENQDEIIRAASPASSYLVESGNGAYWVSFKRATEDLGEYVISKPQPENKKWREKALEAAYRAIKEGSNESAMAFSIKEILGDNWKQEAEGRFGNPLPSEVLDEALSEIRKELEQFAVNVLADKKKDLTEQVKEKSFSERVLQIKMSDAVRSLDTKASEKVRSLIEQLKSQDYDFDRYDVQTTAKSRLYGVMDMAKKECDTIIVKELIALQEQAEGEREATAEKLLPDAVKSFFEDLGIRIRVNAEKITWQARNKGSSNTSEAGSRVLLFDPAGRGGKLASVAVGKNSPLQSKYNSTWSIFDDDLWWHFKRPESFDELMEIFK